MEKLLQEQQKALQYALDLHAAMLTHVCTVEGQAKPGFEARVPPVFSPPSLISNCAQTIGPDAPLSGRSVLRSMRDNCCIPMASPRHVSYGSAQEVTKNNGDSDVWPWEKLSEPLLAENYDEMPTSKISTLVDSMQKNFQNERHLVNATKEQEINIDELYNKTGFWASWMKNGLWEKITFFAILTNTIYIALDTDYNKAPILVDAPLFFQIMGNLFCLFFTVEIGVRFLALRKFRFVLYDSWFIFESFLVLLLVWDNWIQVALYLLSDGSIGGGGGLACFSILRVFRVFRLLRALRALPELMVLVSGMLTAMRSVLATVLLLALTIYLFGILFTQLLAESALAQGRFDKVPNSMHFLLVQLLSGADADFMGEIRTEGPLNYFLWLLFLFLGQLTIMNMLIGVVCNAIDDTKEEIHESQFCKEVTKQVGDVISAMDEDNSGTVSREEFLQLMSNGDFAKMLYPKVDLAGLSEYFDGVYRGVEELALNDVLDMILQFRQSKSTTIKDLLILRRMILMELATFEDRVPKLEDLQPVEKKYTWAPVSARPLPST